MKRKSNKYHDQWEKGEKKKAAINNDPDFRLR